MASPAAALFENKLKTASRAIKGLLPDKARLLNESPDPTGLFLFYYSQVLLFCLTSAASKQASLLVVFIFEDVENARLVVLFLLFLIVLLAERP